MFDAKIIPQKRSEDVKDANTAARIIHLGPDSCHRLMVLHCAGYAVETCESVGDFATSLEFDDAADAVLVSEGDGFIPEEAALLVRRRSAAPVILFRNTNRTCEETRFDLVVQSLTPPQVWLNQVDAVIARNRRCTPDRPRTGNSTET
jgi:hypothetical protein